MIKFITFTDVHISDTNPESRIGDYKADILAKLNQIGLVGKKLGVDFYIFAGDLFHIKSPFKNSHNLNRSLIETFSSFGAPIYSVEGNHDLRYDSYETFSEQPLGVLYAAGVLKQIREVKLSIKGEQILLRGAPFSETPDLENMPKNAKDEAIYSVRVLHLYATPKGGMLFKQKLYSYEDIAKLNDDIFVLGHYHIDQGVQIIDGKYFINVGSIARGALVEDDISRSPKIGYVELDAGKVKVCQAIKLKVKSAETVFKIEEKKQEKEKVEAAEQFVEKLQTEMKTVDMTPETIDSELSNTNIEKSIIDKVKYYLTEADLVLKGMK